MGRKTYESIGRPLPNRRNIIISSTIRSIDGAEVFSSLEAALEALKHEDEIIITGGSYLFNDTTDIVNKLVVAVTLAVPVIGPIVPVSDSNSLPDTKTVNTPSACPTAVVASTPLKTAVPFPVTVVVPTEVSNSFCRNSNFCIRAFASSGLVVSKSKDTISVP